MWFFDKLLSYVKIGKDKIVSTSVSVGNYLDETSWKMVSKLPVSEWMKHKAEEYTKKTVDWIGEESKTMIQEWKDFVYDHMHKDEKKAAPAAPVKPEEKPTSTSQTSHPHKK